MKNNLPDDGQLTAARNYLLVVVGSHHFTPQENMDIKEFVIANWKNAEALKTLLGLEFDKTDEFHFGSVPTEQARIEVTEGRISRVATWAGLSWTARYGYGSPVVDVRLYEIHN